MTVDLGLLPRFISIVAFKIDAPKHVSVHLISSHATVQAIMQSVYVPFRLNTDL